MRNSEDSGIVGSHYIGFAAGKYIDNDAFEIGGLVFKQIDETKEGVS